MVKTVARCISLANAPALTDAELLIRARDWSEVLWQIIPEERLADAFNRAAKDHSGSFPISAYDIKNAFWELRKDEVKAQEQRRQREMQELEQRSIQPGFEPCPRCFSCGFRYVVKQEYNGREYSGVIKCDLPGCDHWERALAKGAKR